MSADIPTLALISGCIAILQALAFCCTWALNRSAPGLGRWTLTSLFGGSSLLLVLCRQGFNSPLLTHWLPTLLAWAGMALLYAGAAEFRGRRARLKWPLLCCVPALAGYLWFGWASPLTWLRPAFYSTPMVLFLGLAAREWLGEQRAGLRMISCCSGVAAVIYALSYVFRAWLIAVHQVDPEPLQGAGAPVLVIVTTLLWLSSQRRMRRRPSGNPGRSLKHSMYCAAANLAMCSAGVPTDSSVASRAATWAVWLPSTPATTSRPAA
jgi:hypothetical protein